LDQNGNPYATDLNEYLENKFADETYAIEYLQDVLETGEYELFFAALGDIAKVRGMGNIAEATGFNRVSLYKMLSENGNPAFKNIAEVLSELGIELHVRYKTSTPTQISISEYDEVESASLHSIFRVSQEMGSGHYLLADNAIVWMDEQNQRPAMVSHDQQYTMIARRLSEKLSRGNAAETHKGSGIVVPEIALAA
jgi:probable addiction module antidote protein